jgi:hypothetical protein
VAEAADDTPREDASTPSEAPAIKAKAAKAKPERKPAVGKAKTSKSKRTEAELLEILQKADIQV